jgi:hypothetical protein
MRKYLVYYLNTSTKQIFLATKKALIFFYSFVPPIYALNDLAPNQCGEKYDRQPYSTTMMYIINNKVV